MRILFAIFAFTTFLISNSLADDLVLEVGQVWEFENSPSADTRVIIGKIEEYEGSKIAHVIMRNLPDIDRKATAFTTAPQFGEISGTRVGRGNKQFECHYFLTPTADMESVSMKIGFMPFDYQALASSLTRLESSGAEITVYFDRSWDRWDYLREPFEGDYREFTVANMPLSKALAIAKESAISTLKMFERVEIDMLQNLD